MQNDSENPAQKAQSGADTGAEQAEVAQGAEGEAHGQMQPHPPLLQHGGREKQHPKRCQPKEHIQELPAPAHRQGVPQQPQQVVDKTQQQARRKAEEKREGLALWGEGHPRNRRLSRPGWRVSSSS